MRTAARVALAGFLLIAAAAPAAAQFGDYPVWLERSYFQLTPLHAEILTHPEWYPVAGRDPDDELLFEARIAPQLYFFNTLREDVFTRDGPEHQWAFGLAFSPLFVVRQLGSFSSPLRSPSFMPKFAFQAHLQPGREEGGPLQLWTFQIEHRHHSNGGEPCLFQEEERTLVGDDEECLLTVSAPATDLRVDTTGSFSTNYFQGGVFWSRYTLHNDQVVNTHVGLGLEAEVHPEGLKFMGLVGGGASDLMREVYGPNRIRFRARASKRVQWGEQAFRLRGDASATWIDYDDRPTPDAANWAYEADLSFTLDRGFEAGPFDNLLGGWGLQLRYYRGQDYYNLLFFRDIERLQVGLVIDQFDYALGGF